MSTRNGAPENMLPTRTFFGISFHALAMDQVVELCNEAICSDRSLTIGVVNAAKLVKMRGDVLLRHSVVNSDLVLADGMSIVWASRLLKQPLPMRIAGIDLFERLLLLAAREHYSVYLLGAAQNVLDEVVRRIAERHPGVVIAGSRNGYFGDEEADAVAAEIAAARPDMLFIAITSPKKEIFLASHGSMTRAKILHGVGGSFDVYAGLVRRAPRFWQHCGLEWLYRVIQEPRRMWKRYLTTNSVFLGMLVRELVHRWRVGFRE